VSPPIEPLKKTNFFSKSGLSQLIPNVGAPVLDKIGHFADPGRIKNWFNAIVKDRQRHAPAALSRNTPVRARLDGRVDSVSTPVRNPVDSVNRFKCCRLQDADADKELFDGAKN